MPRTWSWECSSFSSWAEDRAGKGAEKIETEGNPGDFRFKTHHCYKLVSTYTWVFQEMVYIGYLARLEVQVYETVNFPRTTQWDTPNSKCIWILMNLCWCYGQNVALELTDFISLSERAGDSSQSHNAMHVCWSS